jgi:hypothetical protein
MVAASDHVLLIINLLIPMETAQTVQHHVQHALAQLLTVHHALMDMTMMEQIIHALKLEVLDQEHNAVQDVLIVQIAPSAMNVMLVTT